MTVKNQNNNRLKCFICNKGFSYKEALDNHLMDKHYCCPNCKRIESNRDSLDRHRAFIHYVLNCPICDNFSTDSYKLRDHVKKVHKIKYFCFKCNEIFIDQMEFIEHNELIHKPPHQRFLIQEKQRRKKEDLKRKEIERRNKQKQLEKEEKYDQLPNIDLHDFYLEEAITYIKEIFDKHSLCTEFKIIHGFKHGNTLQKFVRSIKFKEVFLRLDYKVEVLDKNHKVYTIVKIKKTNNNK